MQETFLQTHKRVLLSLVIPTFNEADNICLLVQRVHKAISAVTDSFEIIIVDDDSPDETWRMAQELTSQYPQLLVIRRVEERGLATAVLAGWRAARGELLGVIDGDLQHPPETLQTMIQILQATEADIVVASRHVQGGGVSRWSFIRRLTSWSASLWATFFLPGILSAVRDPMSGFFVLRRSILTNMPLNPLGYKILLEVLARSSRKRIVEVPYVFEERRKGGSKLGYQQIVEFFVHVARLSWDVGELARLARYAAVGLTGALLNGVIAFMLAQINLLNVSLSVALAIECAIIHNFTWNEIWTFQDRVPHGEHLLSGRLRRLVAFHLVSLVGLCLNLSTFFALRTLVHAAFLPAVIGGILLAGCWNFFFNAHVTWRVWHTKQLWPFPQRVGFEAHAFCSSKEQPC